MPDALLARLSGLDPFSRFDAAALSYALGSTRLVDLDAGDVLVRAGDVADEVYVILEGEVAVIADEPDRSGDGAQLATLGPGKVVGEVGVLTAGDRSATLRATSRTQAVALPSETFLELLGSAPEVGAELAVEASARLREAQLARQLSELFPDLVLEAVAELIGRVSWVALRSGDVLFRQGDVADAAYVVVSGRLRVIKSDLDGLPEVVAEVGSGELVGEIALLDDSLRNATIVAARDAQLARIDREAFEQLVVEQPGAMLSVARVVVRRQRDVRDAYNRAEADSATIALVPLGGDGVIAELGAALAVRLARFGRAVTVTDEGLSRALATPNVAAASRMTPDGLRVAHWLDEMEDRHRFVVLETDDRPSAWTRRCVDRADHVVLVADASDDAAITDVERELVAERELPHQRVSLVLIHPGDAERPNGTRAWLEPRDLDEHHHVRRGSGSDLDRLARHLGGRAVTVALSGGGAKGFAHLGVIQAMRELGLPIDGVAGSSMGAPLAALVAMDLPPDELIPRTAQLYRNVLDYTIPVTSVISARRIARAIREATDGRDVEDLWLPYFCVSTNLTRSRLVVHRRGGLATAIRASTSIPGVMPPVPHGEDLLVDGGVLNNLPVDVMRRLNPTGTVIASDVAPQRGPRAKLDYGLSLRGASVLAKRMTPGMKAPRVPSLMATLMRSLLVAAAEARDRGVRSGLADLHMEFDLRGVSLLDFDATERVAEMGYQQAKAMLGEWLSEHAPAI